jgi:hypothetical protein
VRAGVRAGVRACVRVLKNAVCVQKTVLAIAFLVFFLFTFGLPSDGLGCEVDLFFLFFFPFFSTFGVPCAGLFARLGCPWLSLVVLVCLDVLFVLV